MSATSSSGASCNCATNSVSIIPSASSIISGPTKAGCRRRASMRSAPARAPSGCASGRWAISCRSIIRCGSPRRSRIVDQMLGGRMELGLVPGINPDYFRPFGLDYGQRKSPTLEFVDYLRAAFGETQPFSFHGEAFHTDSAELAVKPVQRPHPPLWMMSRDPQTLEFCARDGDQSRLLSGLSARRRGAALSQVSGQTGKRAGRPREAEHRLQHGLLCRRDRPEGARHRAVPREPRL